MLQDVINIETCILGDSYKINPLKKKQYKVMLMDTIIAHIREVTYQ